MVGRPSLYNEAVVSKICAAIAESELGLEDICAADDSLPHQATVYRWLDAHPEFRERYARAQEQRAALVAENALKDALTVDDPTHAQLARLRFDARKWLAGKLAPKKWGDKVETSLTGSDGGPATLTILTGVPRAGN